MEYISTRGDSAPLRFSSVVMEGLARDGGLYLPVALPDFYDRRSALRGLGFVDLAFAIMRPFVDLTDADLSRLLRLSYATFRDPRVTPLVAVGNVHVLELFHGPTLAFKDVALQFLGNLFSHILKGAGETLNIVAATSGDTGSAAIHGVRGKPGMQIFVMHPKGRTSKLQELQMTTVMDANVHNIAVDGTFDDCQELVKALFRDLAFRDQYQLGAVNSINWARVLAQVTYFAYASLQVTAATGAPRVRFSVPTGNFGDVFAGYLAARMGFPISKLIVATNENDILARFFATGAYAATTVKPTISPSMDIQVASNFERYLYYCLGGDGKRVETLLREFARTRRFTLPATSPEGERPWLAAGSAGTRATLDTIRSVYRETGYLLDPHTAVGYHVAQSWMESGEPMVCLATAHPAKFPDAIREALGADLAHHPILDDLASLPVRSIDMAVDEAALKEIVVSSRAC
ncbi:MAG: threonine synthase [Kiritimatiellia bacterium]